MKKNFGYFFHISLSRGSNSIKNIKTEIADNLLN